ncbi:MAG: type II toxin-antitoxin system prevent-host-death family antitoxin [Pontimonas sp.]|nr:type II toxin-antitoxin system prevent-host-death family antitoxin [Pontimonas sp.]
MPPTRIVNMAVAKATLSTLVRQAHAGDEIIIARAGKPVAKLLAYTAAPHRSILGAMKDVIPEISDEDWEASDRDVAKLWKDWSTRPLL